MTALTIAEPYRVASMDAVLISISEDEYEEESRRMSEKALDQVKMAAEAAGVPCETIREVHDQPYRAIIDAAHAQGLRPHRHGLARAARHLGLAARQRDRQSLDPLDNSRAGLPLTVDFRLRLTRPAPPRRRPRSRCGPPPSRRQPDRVRMSASASRPDDEPSVPTASSRSRTGVPGGGAGPAVLTRAMRLRAVPRCFMRETTSWPT